MKCCLVMFVIRDTLNLLPVQPPPPSNQSLSLSSPTETGHALPFWKIITPRQQQQPPQEQPEEQQPKEQQGY